MYEELEESELGSQEYWNNVYQKEVRNFKSHGDVGEIWFGEDIADRVMRWMDNNNIRKEVKIIDVGCGNGMMLVELFNEGYINLYGVDYSENAIELAKEVMEKYNCKINYTICNVLSDNMILSEFDIVFDKGTYDAISLSADAKQSRNMYIENVSKMLNDNGFLILNSCNWTNSELTEQFKEYFIVHSVIPTPQFKFGGKVGNVVTSIAFKKKL